MQILIKNQTDKHASRNAIKDGVKLRPFFPFYGSKWNIARHYPSPKHNIVIEPFAGSAGYSTFYSCHKVHLIDVDPIITSIWTYLINVSAEEIMDLPELLEAGDCVDNYSISQEAKWLIGFWLNRGSASPKKTRTSYSARTDKAQLVWGLRAKERIAKQIPYIREWKVTQGSYVNAPDVEATWFIDPPYTDKGKYYRKQFNEYFDLAQWSLERKGSVTVCEGDNASWLPFKKMGDYKTSLGRSKEAVFLKDENQESELFFDDKKAYA